MVWLFDLYVWPRNGGVCVSFLYSLQSTVYSLQSTLCIPISPNPLHSKDPIFEATDER
jgi:hypothetical protein